MYVCSFSLFNKSLSSGVATMFLMFFLTFHSSLACFNVYRFVASSLFSCCPMLYIIFVCYSCVAGTEIKDTNHLTSRTRKVRTLELDF